MEIILPKVNYIIRKAVSDDAEQWINLGNLVWRDAYKNILPERVFIENESLEKVTKAKENFTKIILAPNRISYVVTVDQKIIGFMSGVTQSNYEYFGQQDYADLERIYIHPNYQHFGIGKKLFDAFVADLKKLNIDKFVIGVFKDNSKARCAYEKWGGTLSDYTQFYTKHNVKVPEVFYTYNCREIKNGNQKD